MNSLPEHQGLLPTCPLTVLKGSGTLQSAFTQTARPCHITSGLWPLGREKGQSSQNRQSREERPRPRTRRKPAPAPTAQPELFATRIGLFPFWDSVSPPLIPRSRQNSLSPSLASHATSNAITFSGLMPELALYIDFTEKEVYS